MFNNTYKNLTINGIHYSELALRKLVKEKLETLTITDWEKSLFQFIEVWINETDPVTVQTSGSTGKPKKIELQKEKMVASAKATGLFFELDKGQKALLCLPCDYIAGKMMVVRSFVLGLNLIAVSPSGNPMAKLEQRIDFAAMIPLQVLNGLENHSSLFQNVDKLIIGGGVVDDNLKSKLQLLTTKCYATYGMTETITHIAIKRLNTKLASENYEAIAQVSFEKDSRNCLVINAPHLSDDKVTTNDVIDLKNTKTFEFLGRFDNVINTGGVKINPEQVEKKISTFLKSRFFVIGLEDEKLGQKIVLVIEGKEWKTETKEIFIKKMKTICSKFEIPKALLFVRKFEETPTGKIQRSRTMSLI